MTLPTLYAIKGDLSLFDDWTDKYGYLIDLGRLLPPFPHALRTEETRIDGCTSNVWMIPEITPDTHTLSIQADSDALIVKGLLAIVLSAYQDCPVEDAEKIDLPALFNELGLNEHLTPNRRNGFIAMIAQIHSFIKENS